MKSQELRGTPLDFTVDGGDVPYVHCGRLAANVRSIFCLLANADHAETNGCPEDVTKVTPESSYRKPVIF